MGFRLEWHDKEVIRQVDIAADIATRKGAQVVLRKAKQKVRRLSGELAGSIKMQKSTFSGWIIGIFAADKSPWPTSLGARAIFLEFGHAFPGWGRDYVGRKNVRKQVRPYPFIRPALRSSKHEINRFFEGAL